MTIQDIIRSFGLTTEGFADRIGIPHHHAQRIASGEVRPDLLTQHAIVGLGRLILSGEDPFEAMSRPIGPLMEPLRGDTWAKRSARVLMPVIIEHMEANPGQVITYKEAYARAVERGAPGKIGSLTKMGHPLGALARSVASLAEAQGIRIPPFPVVVVRRTTRLPGSDIDPFLRNYVTRARDRDTLDDPDRRHVVVVRLQGEVLEYAKWRKVASAIGLRMDARYDDDWE